MYKATERCVRRPDMKPGPCPRCGGTLEWKATVGTPQTVEAHFYECESCHHVVERERKLYREKQ